MSQEQFDQIGNLLKVNSQKRSGKVRIESDVLEPQQSSQSYATFNLRKAGILSNDSRLVLPLYTDNADTRLTMYGGAYGILKNATLRDSSGVVIAQTTDVNYLASIRNHWQSQEQRLKVGKYKNGTYNCWEYGGSHANAFTGKFKVTDMDALGSGDYDQKERHRLGTTTADRVEYVISFRELFPELFPTSLPLFALDGNVQLFLEFSEQGPTGEVAVDSFGVNNQIGNVLIDLANLKFISDHVFLEDDAMRQIYDLTKTSTGLVIPYADYNQITFTHTAPAQPSANNKTDVTFTNSIGMSGLRVKHLLIHNSEAKADATPTEGQKIAGKYASFDSYAGVNGQKLNVQVNNENYYTQDLPTQEWYREVEDVYGVPMQEPYPVYTTIQSVADATKGDGSTAYTILNRGLLSTDTIYDSSQTLLTGSACVAGVNFCNPLNRINNGSNGIMVSNAPVQLSYTHSFTNTMNTNILQRVFVCVERVLSIKDGQVRNNYS